MHCRFPLTLLTFFLLAFLLLSAAAPEAFARIDLAARINQQSVKTTIYNNADLTLVQDERLLWFAKGMNQIQFSWADTRIDPTSLSIEIPAEVPGLTIAEISYPAGTKEMGIWHIKAEKACQAAVRITYFTSGISWSSHYTLILSKDMQSATLTNHIDIKNGSGEDYINTRTRLVVGKIHLLDRIAALADRPYPYGKPGLGHGEPLRKTVVNQAVRMLDAAPAMEMMAAPAKAAPRPVLKKSLSEYFLYTLPGVQSILDRWSKRLASFTAGSIAARNLFRYDDKLFGPQTIRFITIENDKKSGLGATPLPPGRVMVFERAQSKGDLAFIGDDAVTYVPVGKPLELNLGASRDMRITPLVMDIQKSNIRFNPDKNVIGFDDIRKMKVTFSNFMDTPAIAEYTQHMETHQFQVSDISHPGAFIKKDKNTIVFTVELPAHATQDVTYTLTYKRGDSRWQK